jgi:hypothetical protein
VPRTSRSETAPPARRIDRVRRRVPGRQSVDQ